MTPLHILALSTTPNLGLCQALTKRSTTDLTSRDHWGSLPMGNFAVNFSTGMIPSIKFVMILSYANRLAGLGLKEWRRKVVNDIENLKEGADPDERLQQVFRIRSTVSQYRKKEQVSLMELAIWKTMLVDASFTDGRSSSPCPHRYRKKAKTHESTESFKNGVKENERQRCRMLCGADVIVANVLPFL